MNLDQLSAVTDKSTEYTLSVEDNRRIFREQIVPELFGDPGAHPPPSGAPSMVFLIGQQGAGKTHFADRHAPKLFGHSVFVSVDSDSFKPFHPDYEPLLCKTSPMPGEARWAAAEATRPDVHRWQAQAEHFVLEHRLNAVMQYSSKNPDTVAAMMRRAGYRDWWRWAIFLGVPEARSRQGRLYRFYADLERRGYGRLTRPHVLGPAYAGSARLADMIENGGLVERATVYRQSGFPVPEYDHYRLAHGSYRTGRLREVLDDERTRPFTEAETEDFEDRQAWLWGHVDPEFHDEMTLIDRLSAPLLLPPDPVERRELRGITGVTS